MNQRARYLFLSILSISMLFCIGSPLVSVQPTQDVGSLVRSTFQALTAQAPTSAPTTDTPTVQAPSSGSIAGKLGYPSEGIPPLRIVALNIETNQYIYVDTVPNQLTYQIDKLPSGTYHVFAYRLDSDYLYGAGYSQFILCGQQAGCDDHSLVDISIAAGQSVQGIDPNDWCAPPGSFPTDPSRVVTIPTGSISGALSYPSEFIPPLRVVAIDVATAKYYFVDTVQGQDAYQIGNLPIGIYHVVAYTLGGTGLPSQLPAGYSMAVQCGLQSGCDDHSLIDVPVNAGQVTPNIDPTDWYAPEGVFPPDPSR
jgi:hypothetical protein